MKGGMIFGTAVALFSAMCALVAISAVVYTVALFISGVIEAVRHARRKFLDEKGRRK